MKPTRHIILFSAIALLLFFFESKAQQVSLLNNFYRNPYLFNPAYSRNDSLADAMAIYRNQWTGIQGAPQTQVLSVNGVQIKKSLNLGAMVTHETSNITKTTGIYLSTSYAIKLADNQSLRLGVSCGYFNYQIDFKSIKVKDPSENILTAASGNRSAIDGSAGIYYRYSRLELGASSLHLFKSRVNYADTEFNSKAGITLLRHYFVFAKYNTLYTKGLFRVSPLGMLRSTQSLPLGWDLGAIFEYSNLLSFSPVYKHKYGLALTMGLSLNNSLNLVYSYEVPTNGIGAYVGQSHEIALHFTFKGRKGKKLPETMETTETKEKPKTKKVDEKESSKKKESEQKAKERYEDSRYMAFENKMDSLQKHLMELQRLSQGSKTKRDTVEVNNQSADQSEKYLMELELTRRELKRLEAEIQANMADKHFYVENEHIKVDSLSELDTLNFNYFVVAGTFHDQHPAEFLSRNLKSQYGINALIMTKEGVYNVVILKVKTKGEALNEIMMVNEKVDKKYMPLGARLYRLKK